MKSFPGINCLLVSVVLVTIINSRISYGAEEKVFVKISSYAVINEDFKGIGVNGDFFSTFREASKNEKAILKARVEKVNPSIVRLFVKTEWFYPKPLWKETEWFDPKRKEVYKWDSKEMKDFCEVLDLYKSIGSEIILTIWRPFTYDAKGSGELIDIVAKLMDYLQNTKGYSNISYLMIYNEPDLEFNGSTEDYKHIYTDLNEKLKKAGIRNKVKLTAPDDALSFQWFAYAVDNMDSLVDLYDSHHYDDTDALKAVPWMGARINLLKERKINKQWFIAEFGGNMNREDLYYGQFIVDYVIAGLNAGASAMLFWHIMSQPFPETEAYLNDMGLWGYLDRDLYIRPVYYAYTLLTRNFRNGMKVVRTDVVSGKALAAALKNAEGKLVLLVSSRGSSSEFEFSGPFAKDTVFKKYVYDKSVLDFGDDRLIEPVDIKAGVEGVLSDTLNEKSCVMYVQQ